MHTEEELQKRREYANMYNARSKAKGLCVQCHKPVDRDGSLCSACSEKINEKSRRDRAFYKENGLCLDCGSQVYDGKSRCEMCRIKRADAQRAYYQKNKERIKEQNRQYRSKSNENKKANGMCIRCGEKAMSGKTLCYKHSNEAANRMRAARGIEIPRSQRYEYDLCYQCGKKGLAFGKKLCPECIEKSVRKFDSADPEKVRKNRERIKRQIDYCFIDKKVSQ